MVTQRRHIRVLMYSHDTFGLGHLRRTRAIAHSLVEQNEDLSVLILTGSPIIGSFDFRSRVDFVRIPGVIKLKDGNYTTLKLKMAIEDTLAMRASIIKHTAEAFNPDLFIVDKEPLGLRGEVHDTLISLKERGTPLVLGLRDVMDDPDLLEPEWKRKNVNPALRDLYDQIWVYGLPQICDPLEGVTISDSARRKMVYTGYLKRQLPATADLEYQPGKITPPYILVTPGGGGDGDAMVDWVLRAYEHDPNLPHPALVVFGPFMKSDRQSEFMTRVDRLSNVEAITFDARMESLMEPAVAVVAMGGYNTFCEILSFDKRALIIPRTRPRMEQFIRASRAQDLGLVTMLEDRSDRDPIMMATALRQLPQQQRPSEVVVPGLMDGLSNVNRLAENLASASCRYPQRLTSTAD
ncbi:glycosyltransferase family protein [Aestuariispira insulae]|uniref:Putative glycosyltransferase n=1 Tax=Aestuariispira insulae TaxID=1461337 RepID=A0A3D9HPA2_9PROT|nr:glycosyltransferase [Aestuariispira insulae]RED51328.1 putative glycosyltransferase [Aestuariispira insulae]